MNISFELFCGYKVIAYLSGNCLLASVAPAQ